MNWETIKHIYRCILIHNRKIEYLGGDKYKLTDYYLRGGKSWEAEYKNRELHGKCIGWFRLGQKHWEKEYQDGKLHGKYIGWYENGNKDWEHEYQNGELIK